VSALKSKVIFLDRDGVLNKIVVHQELGTIDSPMNVGEVELLPKVPEALLLLSQKGFELVITTNQPAAAKGKTTLANLNQVHAKIVELCEKGGARITTSKLCLHRAEDNCNCRKPQPGMLLEYLQDHPHLQKSQSWIIGDSATDVQAGVAAGVQTAFMGPQKCDACKVLSDLQLKPGMWVSTLFDFAQKA
jgi:D-glycero-D-manno-heptose 1,7-bisphosphate phosphatase